MADWTPPANERLTPGKPAWAPPQGDALPVSAPAAARPAPDGGSAIGALWKGLVHGAGDALHGVEQLAHRMPSPMTAGAEANRQKMIGAADTSAKTREATYQAAPETKAHPWVSL